MMILAVHATILWTRLGGDQSIPNILQKSSLACTASLAASDKSATPSSSCKEVALALCKRSPLVSSKGKSAQNASDTMMI